MNTPDPYERRLDRTLPDTGPATEAEAEAAFDALAVHRDPSIPTSHAAGATVAGEVTYRPRSSIAWVRPSEMPTLLGTKIAGRGIDFHTELASRAHRAPGAAASKATRRVTRTSIARPNTPSISDQGGLGL